DDLADVEGTAAFHFDKCARKRKIAGPRRGELLAGPSEHLAEALDVEAAVLSAILRGDDAARRPRGGGAARGRRLRGCSRVRGNGLILGMHGEPRVPRASAVFGRRLSQSSAG